MCSVETSLSLDDVKLILTDYNLPINELQFEEPNGDFKKKRYFIISCNSSCNMFRFKTAFGNSTLFGTWFLNDKVPRAKHLEKTIPIVNGRKVSYTADDERGNITHRRKVTGNAGSVVATHKKPYDKRYREGFSGGLSHVDNRSAMTYPKTHINAHREGFSGGIPHGDNGSAVAYRKNAYDKIYTEGFRGVNGSSVAYPKTNPDKLYRDVLCGNSGRPADTGNRFLYPSNSTYQQPVQQAVPAIAGFKEMLELAKAFKEILA